MRKRKRGKNKYKQAETKLPSAPPDTKGGRAMSIWSHLFSWENLFSWTFLAWTEAILIGGVLAMIGIAASVGFDKESSRFWLNSANLCFALAAIIFLAKVTQVAVTTDHPRLERVLFALALFGVVGATMVEVIRGINGLGPLPVEHSAQASEVVSSPTTSQPTPPITVIVKTVMFTKVRSHSTITAGYKSFHGFTISPVDIMLGLQITNTGEKPINVAQMQVSIPDIPGFGRADWQKLTMIPLSGSSVYIGGDLRRVNQITVSDIYSELSAPLEPNKTLQGFAIFEFPDTYAGSDFGSFKFDITDTSNKTLSVVVGGPVPSSGEVNAMALDGNKATVDISRAYRKLYTEH